jgi:hypothetical protein
MPRRDLTDVPPSRWRVVERNRRLEVVDTHTGKRVATPRVAEPPVPGRNAKSNLPLLRRTRFDGGGELTTHRLFDEKAPRTIALDAGSASVVSRVQLGLLFAAMIGLAAIALWPWLLALLVLPFRQEIRRPFRRRITAWLDRVEREAS